MAKMDYSQPINFILSLLLSIFLTILSVLGFRVVISQSLGHMNYILNVLMILDFWKKTCFYKDPIKPFFLKNSYRNFFEITIGFFVVLSLFYTYRILNFTEQSCEHSIPLLLLIVLIVVFAFVFMFIEKVLYRLKWQVYTEKRKSLIRALRRSKGGFCQPDWDEQLEDKNSDLWKKIKETNERNSS